jgi:2-polyprenyl-3-methyl-5-hydroxy-6-metoxy-1,4-benzoquinol methylase
MVKDTPKPKLPKKLVTKGAMKIILESVRNQKVIHVGAVGQKGRLKRHIPLKKACPDIIGFDISKKDIKIANDLGFDEIFYADVTNMEHMKKIVEEYGTFPHVVMPEVIEHVPNLLLLLQGCKKLMSKKGKLYITTPHVFIYKEGDRIPKKHICWFCEKTIKALLNMAGLKVQHYEVFGKSMLVIAERK